MSGNPWSAIASGVSSGLTFLVKICEYTYALRAVDQQTKEYFITAQHAWDNIKDCRDLLDSLKDTFPASEVKKYERVIDDTKKAAQEVALLLEPARVDFEADCKIHMSTRVMWVLSDNSNIAAALRRLDIVHTTLTQNISTLRLMSELARTREKPPNYESSQLLQWKRQSRLTPMPSMQSMKSSQTLPSWTDSSATTAAGDQGTRIVSELPTDTGDYPRATRISASTGQGGNAKDTPDIRINDIAGGLPSNVGRGPRSWLEFQAMKSSRLSEMTMNGGPATHMRHRSVT